MPTLYDKLQRKAHRRLLMLDRPVALAEALATPDGATVDAQPEAHATYDFGLAFVSTLAGVEAAAATLAAAVPGDGLVWFAYPKASSRRHRCEFNRDTGWAALGALGYEPVRQVALDDDWSALRFRRVEHISVMTRHPDGALSAAGRAKALRSGARPGASDPGRDRD